METESADENHESNNSPIIKSHDHDYKFANISNNSPKTPAKPSKKIKSQEDDFAINNTSRNSKSIWDKYAVYDCFYPNCLKLFREFNEFRTHINEHVMTVKHFQCPYEGCGKKYRTPNSFRDHINVSHVKNAVIKCNECGKTYKCTSSLRRHFRKTRHDTAGIKHEKDGLKDNIEN